MRGFNHKKAVQALNLLAKKEGGEVNKMKAIKLLYLADKLHLMMHGRTITGDSYYALPLGTVGTATRDFLEQNKISLSDDELQYSSNYIKPDGYTFRSIGDVNEKVFSRTDLDAINKVFAEYGKFTEWDLSNISHDFQEWKQFEDALRKKIASRFLINTEDFFSPALDKHPLFKIDPLIVETSKEIFQERQQVENYLK